MADSLHTFVPNEVINYKQVNSNFSYLLDKIGSSSGIGKYFDNSLSSIFIGDSTSEYSEYGDGTEVKNNIFIGSGNTIKNLKRNNIVIGSGTYKNIDESILIGNNILGITDYVADDTKNESLATIATFGNGNEIKLNNDKISCVNTLLLGFDNKITNTKDGYESGLNSYSAVIGNNNEIINNDYAFIIGHNGRISNSNRCLLITSNGMNTGFLNGDSDSIPSNFATETNIINGSQLEAYNYDTHAIGLQITAKWNNRNLLFSHKELNSFDNTDTIIMGSGNFKHLDTSIVVNTSINGNEYYNLDRTAIIQVGEYSSSIANTQYSNIIGASNGNSHAGAYDGDNDSRTPYNKVTSDGKNAIPFIQALNIFGNGNSWSDIGHRAYNNTNVQENIDTSIIGNNNRINIASKQENTFNSHLNLIGQNNNIYNYKCVNVIGYNNYINNKYSSNIDIKKSVYYNNLIGNYINITDTHCNTLIGNSLTATDSKFNIGFGIGSINYRTDLGNNNTAYASNKPNLTLTNTTQSIALGSATVSNSNCIVYLGSQKSVPGYYYKMTTINGTYGQYVLVNSNGKLVYDSGAFYTTEELDALGTWTLASEVSELITEANKSFVNPTSLTNVNESYILSNKLTANNDSYLFTVGNGNVINGVSKSYILSDDSTIESGNLNFIVGDGNTITGSSTYKNTIHLNSSQITNTSESLLIGSNIVANSSRNLINLYSNNITYSSGCNCVLSMFNEIDMTLPFGCSNVILVGKHTFNSINSLYQVIATCEGATFDGNTYTYALGGTKHTFGSRSNFCYTFGNTLNIGESNHSVLLVGDNLTVDATSSSFIHNLGYHNTISGTNNKNIFTLGSDLISSYSNQFVIGNINNNKEDSIFEIGNGTSTTENKVTTYNRSNLFRITNKGQILINDDDASVGATRYVTSVATLTTSYGNDGDIAYIINDNNEIASSYTKYNGSWVNIPVGSGGSSYTGPNIVTMTTEQYKTFTDEDKQPNTLYFVTDDNIIEDSGSDTPTPTVPTITLSNTLTINTSDWDSSTKQAKLSVTLNDSAVNQIIFDLPYYETIAKCGVIPIKEETTGITFKCTEIPSENITLKILSTTISN